MLQYQVVYYSEASRPFSEQELVDLLAQANRYNYSKGITGCLIYANGKFMQLLEGEESVVRALYEKIKKDPRHTNLVDLIEMLVNEKMFPDWGMAFKYVDKAGGDLTAVKDPAKWIYSAFNAEASPGKEALFNFAVRNGLMESQVFPR